MNCNAISTHQLIKDIIIPSLALLSGIAGAIITICIYYRNSELRRAEWLHSLFDQFYCQRSYADIRRVLDYGDEKQLDGLKIALEQHSNSDLEEQLVDYLNFFEMLASLLKMKQLHLSEVKMMFEYYINNIGENDFIMSYLVDNHFGGVTQLIHDVRKHPE